MKHIGTRILLALSLTGLLGVTALADSGAPGTTQPGARRAQILQKFDTNSNGVIDPAERQAMQAARKARVLQKFDANKNGVIDPAERQQMEAARKALLLKKFDANKNGVIDPAERKAVSQARARRRLARRFNMMVLRLDASHDGKLSAAELPGKGKGAALKKHFAAMDSNHDGQIERREFMAAGMKVKQHHGKGKGAGPHPRDGKRAPVK